MRDVVVRDVGFEFLHIEFWPRIRNTFGENPFLFLYITLVYLSGICLLNERSFRNHENPLCAQIEIIQTKTTQEWNESTVTHCHQMFLSVLKFFEGKSVAAIIWKKWRRAILTVACYWLWVKNDYILLLNK